MRRSQRALVLLLVALGLASATRGQDQPDGSDEKTRLKAVWGVPKIRRSKLEQAMFLPDGKHALCAFDSEVVLWDVERGRPERTILMADGYGLHEFRVDAFSADGRLALINASDRRKGDWGHEVLYDLESGRIRAKLDDRVKVVRKGAAKEVPFDGLIWSISSDSKTAMASSSVRGIATFDLESGHVTDLESRAPFYGSAEEFDKLATDVAVSAASGRALRQVGRTRPVLNTWDSSVGVISTMSVARRHWERFLMSSDGTRALDASDAGLEHFDIQNGTSLWFVQKPEVQKIPSEIVYRGPVPLEAIAATASWTHVLWWKQIGDSNTLSLLNLATGREIKSFEIPETLGLELALSADAKRAISGGQDRRVHVWDPHAGKEIHSDAHESRITVMAPLPGGKRVFTAADEGTLELRDLADDESALSLGPEGEQVTTAAAFPADGKAFLSCTEVGQLALRELATGKTIWGRPWQGGTALALSPGGEDAFVSGKRGLQRFVVETGKDEVTIHDRAASRARSIAVLPDGKRLLTVGDWGLALWDVATLASLAVEACQLTTQAVSADGSRALVAKYEGTLELRDTDTLKTIQTIESPAHRTVALAFSPDGKLALQADDASTVRVWFLEGGFAIAKLDVPERYGSPSSVAFLGNGREFLVGTVCGYVLRYELLATRPGTRWFGLKGHGLR